MSEETGQIIVRLGQEVVREVALDQPVLSIGRAPDATISLSHPMVSRQHAEIRVEPDGLVLTDTGSSNGTFIDDMRLAPHQPQVLSSGSSFQIGPFQLTYQAAGETVDDEPGDTGEPVEAEIPDVAAVEVAQLSRFQPPAPPRPTYPAPNPVTPSSAYLRDLPVIFQESDFLGRFLLIFESLWEPLEQRQDHIGAYFDPHTAPVSSLPWLASWLDLPLDRHWPESRSRDLLADAMDLYRWRGTAYGLSRLIEVCTGCEADVSEDSDRPFVFDIQVTVPDGNEVSEDLIQHLIQSHKPAHTGFVLEVVRP